MKVNVGILPSSSDQACLGAGGSAPGGVGGPGRRQAGSAAGRGRSCTLPADGVKAPVQLDETRHSAVINTAIRGGHFYGGLPTNHGIQRKASSDRVGVRCRAADGRITHPAGSCHDTPPPPSCLPPGLPGPPSHAESAADVTNWGYCDLLEKETKLA